MSADETPEDGDLRNADAKDVPAVSCHLCGAAIRVWKPFDQLGESFELSCRKCGHLSEYTRDDIITAEVRNGVFKKEEHMTEFYTDDGCLVVISIPRVGATFPLQRAYAVAEKDHQTARVMMEDALPEDEPIVAVTTLPAAVMRELKLSPGEHIGWPEVRR